MRKFVSAFTLNFFNFNQINLILEKSDYLKIYNSFHLFERGTQSPLSFYTLILIAPLEVPRDRKQNLKAMYHEK